MKYTHHNILCRSMLTLALTAMLSTAALAQYPSSRINRFNYQQQDNSKPVVSARHTKVDRSHEGLVVYRPAGIPRMAYDEMPKQDTSVVLCCEAAYTRRIQSHFSHSNVCGDHVLDKVRYTGATCSDNTGGFVYYDGKWQFVYGSSKVSAALDSASHYRDGIGFCQATVIHNYQIVKQTRNMNLGAKEYYRCLCEKDSNLLIIDSKERVSFGRFIYLLIQYGVKNAIYLDMGGGWNHSFYRDASGQIVNIFPKGHDHCTNWIYFTTAALPPLADSVVVANQIQEDFVTPEPKSETTTAKAKTSKKSSSDTGSKYYTVKPGDNLGKIAKKHHTTVSKLCKLNGIKETTIINAGKKLRVK